MGFNLRQFQRHLESDCFSRDGTWFDAAESVLLLVFVGALVRREFRWFLVLDNCRLIGVF